MDPRQASTPSCPAAEGRILEALADGTIFTGMIEEVAKQFALEAHELAACLSALGPPSGCG